MPPWDLLNHVTGQANVRLHHDADAACLQMIATEHIPAGAELINSYGELSNGELLHRCVSGTMAAGRRQFVAVDCCVCTAHQQKSCL